jgi:hypothetical protein
MFIEIKTKVQQSFAELQNHELFVVDLDSNILFDAYIDSFDEADRQEHRCNCCRQFLRNYGGVVAIVNNEIKTMWDFEVNGRFSKVPPTLHKLVKEAAINQVFVSKLKQLGTDFNTHVIDKDNIVKHEHFCLFLPKNKVDRSSKSIEAINGERVSVRNVFKRSLDELTLDSVETVLELIAQNSLYRGEEFKGFVAGFGKHKLAYDKLKDEQAKHLYAWANYVEGGKIRNTAIGTLLVDLSDGMELDAAVRSFESKVAPQNYKRPTALVTKAMIESAEKTIKELGLTNSLQRRYAITSDIPINNLLFVDRGVAIAAKSADIFDELKADVPVNAKNLSKVEEVSIDTFINDILPTVSNIEVLLENRHNNNFMTLVAPADAEAPILFNWDNALSWSYQDGIADSVKERVKNAGGTVDGELRVSLEWFNYDDLDLHVVEPNGERIYFSNKRSSYSDGFLDVDMNAGGGNTREAVENIIFTDKRKMLEGEYEVRVNNYRKRESCDTGFNIEIECQGQVINLGQTAAVGDNKTITVAKFIYHKASGISDIKSFIDNKSPASKEMWGIDSQKFHKVSMLMLSPNHWDDKSYGNKHVFFILDKVKNPLSPRGMFNEFLKPEFLTHKRVFEVLANKMKVTEYEDDQLSGLGFSSTQRNEVVCKVTGKFTRTIKIKF